MRILFFGDLVGRSGREALERELPGLKERYNPDVIIVNAENCAAGFGVTPQICSDLFSWGVDCITLGNHTWDQKEIIPYLEQNTAVIRPLNYPPGTPGRGFQFFSLPNGQKIMVVQLMGRLFMEWNDDPFQAVNHLLKDVVMGKDVAAIFVDMHAEATSEKMAMAHYCDGRVTAVIGTHTHVPTADAQIFQKGTAYQSDAGMCGDYASVIGMNYDVSLDRFLKKGIKTKMTPAMGLGDVAGVFIESDDKTGLAIKIESIIQGGRLKSTCLP